MIRPLSLFSMLALTLAACASGTTGTTAPSGLDADERHAVARAQSRPCDPADYRRYVGQPVINVAAIERSGPIRVMSPGVTQASGGQPNRLNVFTDSYGNARGFSCG